MISSQQVITRVRRDLTISAALQGVFFAVAVLLLFTGLLPHRLAFDGTLVLMGMGAVWIILTYRSMRSSRIAAASPALIASGNYDEAEAQLEAALSAFSLFRSAKLLSLHYLAVLRHAQRRWQESAMLSKVLLSQRLGGLQNLSTPSRLMLAESLLEIGDERGALESLTALRRQRLNLSEALTMQTVQLDYQSRTGQWQEMFGNIAGKMQLAEIMPSAQAARTQAFLALAAGKLGRPDWSSWLRRRAELLADAQELCADRPLLKELWEKPAPL